MPDGPTPTPHWRPRLHITTTDTWLNDPNGLLLHDGTWHVFFQNNPHGNTWGNMSWGHVTSTDLLTWEPRPVALACTDEEEVFSGSAVADVRNTAGFSPDDRTALVAIYTAAYREASPRAGTQAQALAYSLDGGTTWTRYAGNPVLDVGARDFRDPKVFWFGGDDGHWVMVLAEPPLHRVAVYTSPDLLAWTRRSEVGPAHAVGGIWECPDLFPLTDPEGRTRWVLVVSLNPGAIAGGSGTQYFLGDFDGATFTPDRVSSSTDPTTFDWFDFGRDQYAAVSFADVPDGRRLMVGWANNWDYAQHVPTHPWRSALSLVREVRLARTADGDLRLAQRPVLPDDLPEGVAVHDVQVPSGPGDRTHVVLHTDDGPDGDRVVLTVDGAARTVSVDRTASGVVDLHPSFPSVDVAPLLGGEVTDLRVVVDGSVVEVFVDDGLVTFTEQVFPRAPLTGVTVLPARD